MQRELMEAAEAGRALIAECLMQGGPGDPETLERAAALCDAAPALLAALDNLSTWAAALAISGAPTPDAWRLLDKLQREARDAIAAATEPPTGGIEGGEG